MLTRVAAATKGMGKPQSALSAAVGEHLTVLEPGRVDRNYWRDLWRYRELFAILAWRDVSVRYKQTAIGVAWALIRPFLTTVIFAIVFGRLARLPSEGQAPYPVMVFAGLMPWSLFAAVLGDASGSVLGNAHLISKVYFPRLIIPIATAVVALVDFAINFVLLAMIMGWYAFWPGWQIMFLPGFVLLAILASLGPALWITSLNIKYRDFRFVVPFVIQLGLYVSPVGFASSVVPQEWRLLYSINPMVGVIDGFRWCLLGGQSPFYWPGFLVSLGVVAFFLWFGIRYFRATERTFVDML
jgi:lipopolysaccharide transport system permease protein